MRQYAFSSGGQAADTAQDVASKHARALLDGVHQLAYQQGLDALAALVAENQANTDVRAEALRTAALAHGASAGTATVDGAHLAADSANDATLTAVPATDGVTLAKTIALVNGLKAWLAAHAATAGVHFHDDATGAAVTITTDPPTTLAHCRTDLNDLLTAFKAHMVIGQPDTVADIGKIVAGTGVTVTGGGKLANGDVTVAAAWAAADATEAAARASGDTAATAAAVAVDEVLLGMFCGLDSSAGTSHVQLTLGTFGLRNMSKSMRQAGHCTTLVVDLAAAVPSGKTFTAEVFVDGVQTESLVLNAGEQHKQVALSTSPYNAGSLVDVRRTIPAGYAAGDAPIVHLYGSKA